MAMKILLTGGQGRLGKEIKALYPSVYAPTHSEMDLLNRENVVNVVEEFNPDLIIHCAAYTNVALAEKNRELCWKTNVEGTRNLLQACANRPSIHFTYISTACVFRGDRGNYTENDMPYPKNFYGLTKLLGETLVNGNSLSNWLIVRTNFVSRGAWPYDKAFVDRWGTYLYADQVAKEILTLVYKKVTGIVHVCGKEKLSMYELARKYSPSVEPITLEEYYRLNPDSPMLTQDMSLKSIFGENLI